MHPAASEVQRAPNKDMAIPLTTPVVGISGKVHKELLVPAGTLIEVSILGYNLCVDFFPVGVTAAETYFAVPVGTRTCGDQTLTNSDRNDGSIRTKILNHLSGSMATCTRSISLSTFRSAS